MKKNIYKTTFYFIMLYFFVGCGNPIDNNNGESKSSSKEEIKRINQQNETMVEPENDTINIKGNIPEQMNIIIKGDFPECDSCKLIIENGENNRIEKYSVAEFIFTLKKWESKRRYSGVCIGNLYLDSEFGYMKKYAAKNDTVIISNVSIIDNNCKSCKYIKINKDFRFPILE